MLLLGQSWLFSELSTNTEHEEGSKAGHRVCYRRETTCIGTGLCPRHPGQKAAVGRRSPSTWPLMSLCCSVSNESFRFLLFSFGPAHVGEELLRGA